MDVDPMLAVRGDDSLCQGPPSPPPSSTWMSPPVPPLFSSVTKPEAFNPVEPHLLPAMGLHVLEGETISTFMQHSFLPGICGASLSHVDFHVIN